MTADGILEIDTTDTVRFMGGVPAEFSTTVLLALAAEHDELDPAGASLLREFAERFAAHEAATQG